MPDHGSMPGTPTDLPLPPDLAATLGYPGQSRFVGFHFSPYGDDAIYEDGRLSGTAQTWAFLGYLRHRAVAPLLKGIDLGSSEEEAANLLVIDREANRASVVPVAEARAFLRAQHPPEKPLTPEQAEELRRRVDELVSTSGWREVSGDQAEVIRLMKEQSGRMARMMCWLEQCPTRHEATLAFLMILPVPARCRGRPPGHCGEYPQRAGVGWRTMAAARVATMTLYWCP